MAGESALSGPDRDDDGFPDEMDECPETWGVGPVGCPVDIPDIDGDGVEDTLDECPEVPGDFIAEGCPDGDLDGVPDEQDICPDAIGAPESPAGVGCPEVAADDRDGDGVLDPEDACPDDPGPVMNDGCPVSDEVPVGSGGDDSPVTEDSDGDGLVDESDDCPLVEGPLENHGCPAEAGGGEGAEGVAPGDEGDSDGDGIPDGEEGSEGFLELLDMFLGDLRIIDFVEFQALDFVVNEAYEEVYCYASLTQNPPDHYGPFNFAGERSWDITEYMGSITVGVPRGESLPVLAECYGYSGPLGNREFHFIGRYIASHPESDWDGHIITATVTPEDVPVGSAIGDVEGFTATYRICAGSCDEAVLPAPYLTTMMVGTEQNLMWTWEGDYSEISSFKIYINGGHLFSVHANTNLTSVTAYEPVCGVLNVFEVSAAVGDRESPRSNAVVLEGPPCDRKVRITFERIHLEGLHDEDREGQIGPVLGSFWAQGSESVVLRYDGDEYPYGITINSNGDTNIRNLFNTILTQLDQPCMGFTCRDYSSPEVTFIELEVAPETDLTVGAVIYDRDWYDTDTIFRVRETIPFEDIQPGRRVLRSGNNEVVYSIDMLVSAETGDVPDLRITEIAKEGSSGQIRAWVTNTGGTIVNQNIRLDYYDRESGDLVERLDMENITLATGEGKWFQSARSDVPIYGITAVIDPDNRIAESNDDNNTYIAPVLVMVSLDQIQASYCEFFISRYSEHSYEFSTGYGLDTDHITWVAYHLRYPADGYMRYDRYLTEEENYAHPSIEDPRFNIEVPVPNNNNLYISMTGWENDPTSDDFEGVLFVTIPPEDYMNADALQGHGFSEGYSSTHCRDGAPLTGTDFVGFTAWWQISRLE